MDSIDSSQIYFSHFANNFLTMNDKMVFGYMKMFIIGYLFDYITYTKFDGIDPLVVYTAMILLCYGITDYLSILPFLSGLFICYLCNAYHFNLVGVLVSVIVTCTMFYNYSSNYGFVNNMVKIHNLITCITIFSMLILITYLMERFNNQNIIIIALIVCCYLFLFVEKNKMAIIVSNEDILSEDQLNRTYYNFNHITISVFVMIFVSMCRMLG